MRINNNLTALNSYRHYNINNSKLSKDVETLSSGFRVNRAADDAAGLAISEKMRAQIRGLNMAAKNSQDAVSLVQTAEGGLQTIQDILHRMREMSVQAASETNESMDRKALNEEFQLLKDEITRITEHTEFNKMTLLNGDFAEKGDKGPLTIQTGANQGQTMDIAISKMDAATLKVDDLTIETQKGATEAITAITSAVDDVSLERAKLGAFQNRLEFKIQNLDNQAENVSAAESRIRDADMAKAMISFARNNILMQASTAMLAQANAIPENVLSLMEA